MTSCTFKLSVNNFLQSIIYYATPAEDVEKTVCKTSPLMPAFAAKAEASNVAENCAPIYDCIQAFTF